MAKSKIKRKLKRKKVKRVRDFRGRFVPKGTLVKRKYYRPYKPSKKSNYSKFRKSLSDYLRDNNIKLGQLDERTALQNYNELASSIWRENKGISLNIIQKEIPLLVADYVDRKRSVKHKKPVIPKSVISPPHFYFNIQFEVWSDFPVHPYFYATSCSIMSKDVAVKIEGSEIAQDVYEKAFKHWVDWCNDFHRQKEINNDSDKVEIFYSFAEEPIWSDKKKRWEVEIYSCDKFGNFNDFGYKPPDYQPCEEVPTSVVQKEKAVIEEVKEEVKPKELTAKEIIEIEREKQKTFEAEMKKIDADIKRVNQRVKHAIKLKKQGFSDKMISKILGNF